MHFIWLVILTSTTLFSTSSQEDKKYELVFYNQKVPLKSNFVPGEFPIYEKNTELMIALRVIKEHIYKNSSWDFRWGFFSICGLEFKLNSKEVHMRLPSVDGNYIFYSQLNEVPIVINGRYYLPLISTMKLFGNSVDLDKKDKIIKIEKSTLSQDTPTASCS